MPVSVFSLNRVLFAFAVLVELLLFARPAAALAVRTDVYLLAWSKDGKAALLGVDARGPEGGGSRAYRVIGTSPTLDANFTVSSNFSRGGGVDLDRITTAECKRRLLNLGNAISGRHFKGIYLNPLACAQSDRSGSVVVSESVRSDAYKRRFRLMDARLQLDGFVLEASEQGLVLDVPSGQQQTLPVGQRHVNLAYVNAFLSPSLELLLIDDTSDLVLASFKFKVFVRAESGTWQELG